MQSKLRDYALKGVMIEISETLSKLESLRQIKSELGKSHGNGKPAVRAKRRRTMSAAARKAVSARMRKYWAERRKAKASK